MQNGLLAHENDICVEELDEFYIIQGPATDFRHKDSFYEPFIAFCHSAEANRINLNYPIGAYHHDMDTFISAPGQPNSFFSLDPLGDSKCPAGKYLVGYARGYYGEFGDLAQRMAAYAERHGLKFKGAVYVLYLLDEISTVKPDQYLARVAVGISNTKHRKE